MRIKTTLILGFVFISAWLILMPNKGFGQEIVPPPSEKQDQSKNFIVKFNMSGEHTLDECLMCLLSKKQPLHSKTSDHSDSLDEIFLKYDIKPIKALFQRNHKHGNHIKDVEDKLKGELKENKKKHPLRSRRISKKKKKDLELTHIYLMKARDDVDIKEMCNELVADPHVAYCHPDYQMKPTSSFNPDDPYLYSYGSWGQNDLDMWNLRRTNLLNDTKQTSAWDISKGENITIAVIDTGLDTSKAEFLDQLWVNTAEIPLNGIDDDGNGFIDDINGWDFTLNNSNIDDELGHGTWVSGILASAGNNSTGTIGVAPKSKIMSLKISLFDVIFSGNTSKIIEAINYAVINGADVINLSWVSITPQQSIPALEDAVRLAHQMGLVVVVSAGSNDLDVAQVSPNNMLETITVGATDLNDQRALFTPGIPGAIEKSNYGSFIDVVAPGVDILTLNSSAGIFEGFFPGFIIDQDYFRAQGTSISTPQVAGTVALMLAKDVNITNDDVKQILRSTAKDLGIVGFDTDTGYGMLNVLESLYLLSPPSLYFSNPNNMDVLDIAKGSIDLTGVINGVNLKEYELFYKSSNESSYTSFIGPVDLTHEAELTDILISHPLSLTGLGVGTFSLKLKVTLKNDLLFEEVIQFSIKLFNEPPVFESIATQSLEAGEEFRLVVSAKDPNDDILTYSASNLPSGASFKTVLYDGLLIWTPSKDQLGIHTIVFTADDGKGGVVSSEPVVFEVLKKNNAPVVYRLLRVREKGFFWIGYDREDKRNLKYSYRLDHGDFSEPTSNRWVYFKEDIKPGNHTFEVKAIDSDGKESKVKFIKFKIKDKEKLNRYGKRKMSYYYAGSAKKHSKKSRISFFHSRR